jgi:3-carboxy-cis,cis-muconate cycloisomerase
MSGEIFGPIFVPDGFRESVSGRSWLRAMLDAEAALASAEARVGLIPREAARTIASCCEATRFDVEELGHEGRAAGNPVPPLVRALTAAVSEVSEDAARYVHKGATSQDIADSAAMLVSRRALDLILAELEGVSRACARLAEEHRETIMAGRTLLQQALPTTFGLKAAGWLVSLLEGRRRIREVRERGLAAQLGGASGTLASLGESGLSVLGEFARELELAEPSVPWHTDRTRIAQIGGALSLVAGVLGKIALDVILMARRKLGRLPSPRVRDAAAPRLFPTNATPSSR